MPWDGETAVALVHGAVRVTAAAGAAAAELAPGEALTVSADAITPRHADVAREAAWREGAIAFEGIPELEDMHDIDRALVMSEGRKKRGEWLIIDYPEGT